MEDKRGIERKTSMDAAGMDDDGWTQEIEEAHRQEKWHHWTFEPALGKTI